jgi:choline kinase
VILPIKKAVLLAAGRGTRLGGLTAEIPKCMVQVGRYRLLELLLKNLEAAGVTTLLVVTGYQHRVLEDYLHKIVTPLAISTIHCPDYATTNNIVSLWYARHAIDSDFLLLESDLMLTDQMIAAMSPGNCAAVSPLQHWMNGTVVSLNSAGHLDRMFLKGTPRPSRPMYKTVNLYGLRIKDWTDVIGPALDAHVRNGNTGVYYEQAFAEQIALGKLDIRAASFDSDHWYEIDTPEDLRQATDNFSGLTTHAQSASRDS